MIVCVDPGHGGRDPGAIGYQPVELLEKDVNLAVATLLEGALEAAGHCVMMTRRYDRTLSLPARANHANRRGADLFVSVHANAAAHHSAEGMEVFHFPGSPVGMATATAVLTAMLAACPGHRDRGVKTANFSVLRLTRMPAILVELEFLTHPGQLAFLAKLTNQAALALAIADGVGGP
jgi:N-acetylmuramoyl-L-alanine amidase